MDSLSAESENGRIEMQTLCVFRNADDYAFYAPSNTLAARQVTSTSADTLMSRLRH